MSMNLDEHPPAFRLDSHVAGDLDPKVAAHVAVCAACAAYVAATTEGAAAFAGGEGKKAAEFVLALPKTPPRRLPVTMARVTWIVAPLLVAAALVFLVHTDKTGSPLAPVSAEPPIRFKGTMQIAVVRDRRGDQARLTTDVRVGPNDRLRVEVSLDDARPIEVGFLGTDGSWLLLFAPALVEAGTHFSERAARFDDTPTEGWILAGHPDDVERARATRAFDQVNVIPIALEP
jgi:hypothetical protein